MVNTSQLIVMNSAATTQRVTIKHSALTMPKLAVVSEGREVAVVEGSFHDEVPPGEACVYSTDPRGLTLPTVTQIEAEIAKLERDSAKSGNLLHASRGVKARASQGTTPWFAQIFYYAINGITDDEGWHVTHAELPQWIEFALPAARPISRVVLHTPNLRDYDLQFRGADGSVQQAEVRGNTLDVAEHVLAQPVDDAEAAAGGPRRAREGATASRDGPRNRGVRGGAGFGACWSGGRPTGWEAYLTAYADPDRRAERAGGRARGGGLGVAPAVA